jgi:hypothetical protein
MLINNLILWSTLTVRNTLVAEENNHHCFSLTAQLACCCGYSEEGDISILLLSCGVTTTDFCVIAYHNTFQETATGFWTYKQVRL